MRRQPAPDAGRLNAPAVPPFPRSKSCRASGSAPGPMGRGPVPRFPRSPVPRAPQSRNGGGPPGRTYPALRSAPGGLPNGRLPQRGATRDRARARGDPLQSSRTRGPPTRRAANLRGPIHSADHGPAPAMPRTRDCRLANDPRTQAPIAARARSRTHGRLPPPPAATSRGVDGRTQRGALPAAQRAAGVAPRGRAEPPSHADNDCAKSGFHAMRGVHDNLFRAGRCPFPLSGRLRPFESKGASLRESRILRRRGLVPRP